MVKITLIRFSGAKACIELENGNVYWLTRKDLSGSSLKENTEMNDDDFMRTIRCFQYPRALDQAVAMLARRACSKKEIENRLILNRYDTDVIELVLYKLEKEKLIDDKAFCIQWIHYRTGQKYGPARIRRELVQKGIDITIISEYLDAQSTDIYEDHLLQLALKAWKHYGSGEDIYKTRQKVTASLVRKGYSWDLAKKACSRAEKEQKETAR